jgi:hypothetical protein
MFNAQDGKQMRSFFPERFNEPGKSIGLTLVAGLNILATLKIPIKFHTL